MGPEERARVAESLPTEEMLARTTEKLKELARQREEAERHLAEVARQREAVERRRQEETLRHEEAKRRLQELQAELDRLQHRKN